MLSVTLTANVEGDVNCNNTSDDVVITFARNPILNIGDTVNACEGETVTFNDIFVDTNSYSTLSWVTTNGLGVLTDVQSLTPTYQPAPGETGEIEFVLTVQAQSPCTTPVIDSKILSMLLKQRLKLVIISKYAKPMGHLPFHLQTLIIIKV